MVRVRCDRSESQSDGATVWYADWIGGPSLAKIENCQWESIAGDMRVTAFVTGEADTYFSIPAYCNHRGRRVRGYITSTDGNLVFRHCYF
ncbi:hypothetical protein [Bradyrhizobium sp. Tv2a-2]|uniref:hypothetical protein n=1 Tax=Bradyrhizobium sp. Tv2a-2 TaxID=113395 RepID=UPI00042559FD|nr:hypothetical protein [Bradyrhizobium sp. Tv2a-2]